MNLNNKENNNIIDINDAQTDIEKSEKTKKLNKNNNLKNTPNNNNNNNRYYWPHSPTLESKDNIIFKSENLDLKNDNNLGINYELFNHNNNNIKFITNINNNDKNKLNDSKTVLSCKKNIKIKNHLYYSTDNFMGIPYIYEDKKAKELEQKKIKKRLIKQIGQKINVATMKIEILQNYKKNKNLKSIKKKN
jgi:hypothetical protein